MAALPEVSLAFSDEMILKKRIAENFSKAADTYDKAATLQKRVAARTMLGLPVAVSLKQVLDLGTGTGQQSLQLSRQFPEAVVTGMDMAMGMLRFASELCPDRKQQIWCSGDIEALPFRNNSFDLVFSSLAIQWCDLPRVLAEVSQVLKPGGRFVFSTLAEGSLSELDYAWRAVDEPDRVNQFACYEWQKKIISSSTLNTVLLSRQTEVMYYQDVISLLRELKSLGVNTVLAGRNGLITRNKLQGLQRAYERFRTEMGLPLSYQVIYGTLQKP